MSLRDAKTGSIRNNTSASQIGRVLETAICSCQIRALCRLRVKCTWDFLMEPPLHLMNMADDRGTRVLANAFRISQTNGILSTSSVQSSRECRVHIVAGARTPSTV